MSDAERLVGEQWEEAWRSLCLGKETLNRFLDEQFLEMNRAMKRTFRERLCKNMVEADAIPQEIRDVLVMIRGDSPTT